MGSPRTELHLPESVLIVTHPVDESEAVLPKGEGSLPSEIFTLPIVINQLVIPEVSSIPRFQFDPPRKVLYF